MVYSTMPCLIFDDQGATLSTGNYQERCPLVPGVRFSVGVDDPQSLIEHRLATPERPILILLGEGLLVAGRAQSVSFKPGDGGRCHLRVTECAPVARGASLLKSGIMSMVWHDGEV